MIKEVLMGRELRIRSVQVHGQAEAPALMGDQAQMEDQIRGSGVAQIPNRTAPATIRRIRQVAAVEMEEDSGQDRAQIITEEAVGTETGAEILAMEVTAMKVTAMKVTAMEVVGGMT